MLAVKLHKLKKPWLGKGSYLVPVMSWQAGRVQVRHWVRFLTEPKSEWPNNLVRFMTLVRIPAGYPIRLEECWCESLAVRLLAEMGDEFPGAKEELAHFFRPARDVENDVKKRIGAWFDRDVLHRDDDYRGPIKWPQIILGKPLSKSNILWTKDIRLLYQSKAQSEKRQSPKRTGSLGRRPPEADWLGPTTGGASR